MFGRRGSSVFTFAGAAALMAGVAVLAPTVAAAAPVTAPVASSTTLAPAPAIPTPIAPAPAIPTPIAPAPAGAPDSFTKGTKVWFVNETSNSVWVREHHIFDDWYGSEELKPGESRTYSGNYGGVDDVQLRIFRSAEDARENSVFKAIEVDAENPMYSSPWMSVSYDSKYYLVGTIHHYESPLAGAKFMGQRQEDQTYYKYFDLRMTQGWTS